MFKFVIQASPKKNAKIARGNGPYLPEKEILDRKRKSHQKLIEAKKRPFFLGHYGWPLVNCNLHESNVFGTSLRSRSSIYLGRPQRFQKKHNNLKSILSSYPGV